MDKGLRLVDKTEYILKPFSIDQAEGVAEVIRRNLLEVNSKEYPEEVIAAMLKHYSGENLIRLSERRDFYVIEEAGKVKAVGGLEENNIYTVFVDPNCHGLGLGKLIMEKLEAVALSKGYSTTILDASLSAYPFYERLGYSKVREIEDEEFGSAIVMEKVL